MPRPSKPKPPSSPAPIRAALVFPENLTQRAAGGEPVGQWLVDGSDTMVSSALLALRTMPLHLEAGVPEGAYQAATPSFEVALFFNPERRSEVNIVPGLTAIILTMTMVLFTAVALVRERERGNLELLITTPIHPLELMVGKLVPYIFVGLVQITIILGLGRLVFNVPFQGELLSLAAGDPALHRRQPDTRPVVLHPGRDPDAGHADDRLYPDALHPAQRLHVPV